MRRGWFSMRGGGAWGENFFSNTFPLAFFYGVVVLVVLFSIFFGFLPAYALTHGWVNEEYESWGHGLKFFYVFWLTQRVIQLILKPKIRKP